MQSLVRVRHYKLGISLRGVYIFFPLKNLLLLLCQQFFFK
jgi:hypothetical protein